MKRYMLDTNSVSYLIRREPGIAARIREVPMASLCVSAVTEGELEFGLARRPEAHDLRRVVDELLRRLEVLAWDRPAARAYGRLRAELERNGRPMGALDTMIAAHALAANAILVTTDSAFARAGGPPTEDWRQ